ncbi:MAG: spore maturation protein [Lacipirellulaceae bacterium]
MNRTLLADVEGPGASLLAGGFQAFADTFSQWTVPGLILVILVTAWWRSVPVYESFIVGAKEGFGVAISIIPYLVAILFAIKVFLASGVFDDLRWAISQALATVGLGSAAQSLELLPLALTKPLSGAASRGMLAELYESHGPDSFMGYSGSLLMGSSETTFYILAVYYGAVQVKRTRHTIHACLLTDVVAFVGAITLGLLLFSGV